MKQKTLQKNKPIISVRNSMAALFVVLITLMSTNIFAQTTELVKFSFKGLSAYGPSPLTPSVTAANVTAVGLTRGSGLGTINTAAADAWGGTAANTAATQSAATSSNNVVSFALTANTGYKLSLTQIPAYNIRRSGTGFSTGIWQYSINGGTFTDIGSTITWGATTTSAGNAQTAITLSGISALQNVAAGNTITLRILLWGASGTGTWYFNQPTAGVNDLIVNGTVASVSLAPTPTCSANITASGATTFCQGGNVTLTANSGSSYLWSNGATTQSISATTTDSYTVRVIDAAGTCTNTSSATVVTVNALPTASFSANGSTTFCQGDNVTLTANSGSSYLWSNGATTQSISATTAGTYSVRVTNANGCSANSSLQTIVVNSLPAASVSANGSTSLCNGGNVVLTANSANSYLWSNGATAQSISVNTAGSYSVQVTDANGCSNTSALQDVAVYSSPNLNISATNTLLCLGQAVTLTAKTLAKDLIISEYVEGSSNNKYLEIYNGTGASVNLSDYRYQAFHNGAISPTFNVQLTGTLLDGASIVYSNSGAAIYSGQNTSLGLSLSYNGNDAFALYKISTSSFVDIFGSIGQNPGSAWTNGSLTTLDKTLRRKSTVHSGVSVNPSNGFSTLAAEWDMYSTDDVSGLSSHSINDVNYTWSNNSTNNSITETPTVNSVYSISGTDLNGCTSTSSITINVTNIVATASSSSILCNGGSAVVSVSANGGTAPYTGTGDYNVTAGSYSYTVTDANGCSANTSINVSEPSTLSASSTSGNITCNGASTTVTVIAAGGTTPYSGIGNFTVTAGSYNYTVTDANGCTSTTNITVTEPTPLVATITSNAPNTTICNGGTAVLSASISGGLGNINYQWQYQDNSGNWVNVTGTGWSGTNVASPFTSGGRNASPSATRAYRIVVTSVANNQCSVIATQLVTVIPDPVFTITSTNISCFGANNGTASAVLTGGLALNYGYNWFSNDGISTNNNPTGDGTLSVSGLFPAQWVINTTVSGSNFGCYAEASVSITQPALLVASSISGSILCNGGSTNVTVSANGGTGVYVGTGDNTVTAGSYSFTVTDANGCSANTSINVSEPTALVASSSASAILCNGGSAVVSVSANGGTAPYTGTGDFNVTAGSYSYTVTDANGCSANTSINVSQPSALIANSSASSILCNGGTAVVNVSANGGTGAYVGTGDNTVAAGSYNYTVTDANGCSASTSIVVSEPTALVASSSASSILCNGGTAVVNVSANGGTGAYVGTGNNTVSAGSYNYTVLDANGCSAFTSIVVSEPTALVASSSASSILCNGGTAVVSVSANGGTAPYTGTSNNTVTAGSYSYTVTDANGCSANTNIIVSQPTAISANAGADKVVYFGYLPMSCATLNGSATGGTGSLSYSWSNGTTTTNNTVCPSVTTSYVLTATDANGCAVTDDVKVCVVNVVCYAGNSNVKKVEVCHKGNTICIDANGVQAHLAHGCTLGSCAEANACNLSSRMVIYESTSDETIMSEIKLFPNPAKDNLMVTLSNFEEMGSVTYSIVNAIGQVVYKGAIISNETSINISSLNSGMYYFKTSSQTTKPIIFVVQ
ncbi:MAG: lamin tail domain-containing protein [Bacteroidia bacterium]|nr:lamin tail domain-containing protein [Bacteroidia bacterium]